jgi:alkanesulfonate monooxygenase SsuD/methylene tetrahydromethanopterin reductase-like flavin-dependent oxidoreductase (luciferase family)
VQFGLALPNGGPWGDAGRLARLAGIAEAAGWDGVFLEDYVVWQGYDDVATFDPWIALAAVASATARVRIGIMVAALPRRRPWNVAKAAVTLDHLSQGRFCLGVGSGDVVSRDRSFAPFGEARSVRERAAMLDEALAILELAWSGKEFSFEGTHYRVDRVRLRPRPVQQPRIPVWVGGGYPRPGPVERALRFDGSCLYVDRGPGESKDWTPELVAELRARADRTRPDRARFDIVVGGRPRGADEAAERARIRSLADAGATWWVEYVPPNAGPFEAVSARVAAGPLR